MFPIICVAYFSAYECPIIGGVRVPIAYSRWLSSSRKKKIRDIRNFIPVHGKMLKPEESYTALTLQ